jgi:hypothetical protein
MNSTVDYYFLVAADECAAAAAAYDCGVEKMPNITQKMVEAGKGSNVEVTL